MRCSGMWWCWCWLWWLIVVCCNWFAIDVVICGFSQCRASMNGQISGVLSDLCVRKPFKNTCSIQLKIFMSTWRWLFGCLIELAASASSLATHSSSIVHSVVVANVVVVVVATFRSFCCWLQIGSKQCTSRKCDFIFDIKFVNSCRCSCSARINVVM